MTPIRFLAVGNIGDTGTTRRTLAPLKFLSALGALITGCASPKPLVPDRAGTSIPLTYPALLIGTEVPTLNVYGSEMELTTTQVSTGLSYPVQQIIDSSGNYYVVSRSAPFGKVKSVWLDMGTTPYRVFLELKLKKHVNLEQARKMVLEAVRSPRAGWVKDPVALQKAVRWVQSYRSIGDLIAGCRTDWPWR